MGRRILRHQEQFGRRTAAAPPSLTPTGQYLDGVSRPQVYNDSDGGRWLGKKGPKGRDFPAQLDVATSSIQQRAGLPAAETHLMDIDGGPASVQKMFDADPAFPDNRVDLQSMDPSDVLELQKHMALDWMLSNHDAHSGNFLRDRNTGGLVGIDKGQAFKYFGQDSLSPSFGNDINPPLHPNRPVYSTMLDQFARGQGQLHDPRSGDYGDFINSLQSIPDDEYRSYLAPYAESAAGVGKLSTGDPQAFLDAAVARKNSLSDDLGSLYDTVRARQPQTVAAILRQAGVQELPPWQRAEVGDVPDLTQLADIPEHGGRWSFPYQGADAPGEYQSATYHNWGIHPVDAPATYIGEYYGRPRQVFYNPELTQVSDGEFRPELSEHGNRIEDLQDRVDGTVWRGLSEEEMQAARENGYFQSNGSYNFEGQEGVTLFDESPGTAGSYANSYAPYQHMPTFTRPPHVIGIPDQNYPRNSVGEVEIPGQIPLDSVTHHYKGDVLSITPGSYGGYQNHPNTEHGFNGFGEQPSRSRSPSVDVRWAPGEFHRQGEQRQAATGYDRDKFIPVKTLIDPEDFEGDDDEKFRVASGDYQTHFVDVPYATRGSGMVAAYPPGVKPTGSNWASALSWDPRGKITNVDTKPEHQRRGLARGLYQHVLDNYRSDLMHDHALSGDGKSWAEAVGGLPYDDAEYQRRSEQMDREKKLPYAERQKLDEQRGWAQAQRDGIRVSGVTFPYLRNNNGMRDIEGFGQEHEPWGRYMAPDIDEHRLPLQPGWERGTVDFEEPLYVPHEYGDWKQNLSRDYGDLTGKELSQALIDKGFDGVITHDKFGLGEIVDIRPKGQRGHRVTGHTYQDDPDFIPNKEQWMWSWSDDEDDLVRDQLEFEDIPRPQNGNANPALPYIPYNPALVPSPGMVTNSQGDQRHWWKETPESLQSWRHDLERMPGEGQQPLWGPDNDFPTRFPGEPHPHYGAARQHTAADLYDEYMSAWNSGGTKGKFPWWFDVTAYGDDAYEAFQTWLEDIGEPQWEEWENAINSGDASSVAAHEAMKTSFNDFLTDNEIPSTDEEKQEIEHQQAVGEDTAKYSPDGHYTPGASFDPDFEDRPPLPGVKDDRRYYPPHGLNPESGAMARPHTEFSTQDSEQPMLPLPTSEPPEGPISGEQSGDQYEWPQDRAPIDMWRGMKINLNHPDLGEVRRSLYGDQFEDGSDPSSRPLADGRSIVEKNPLGFDNPELGGKLLDWVEQNYGRRDTGLGRHWSTDSSMAAQWAQSGSGGEVVAPGQVPSLPMRIRQEWKGQGEDPYRTNTGGHFDEENEVTMLPGAPVNIADVQIRHPQTFEWHSVLDAPHQRTASDHDLSLYHKLQKAWTNDDFDEVPWAKHYGDKAWGSFNDWLHDISDDQWDDWAKQLVDDNGDPGQAMGDIQQSFEDHLNYNDIPHTDEEEWDDTEDEHYYDPFDFYDPDHDKRPDLPGHPGKKYYSPTGLNPHNNTEARPDIEFEEFEPDDPMLPLPEPPEYGYENGVNLGVGGHDRLREKFYPPQDPEFIEWAREKYDMDPTAEGFDGTGIFKDKTSPFHRSQDYRNIAWEYRDTQKPYEWPLDREPIDLYRGKPINLTAPGNGELRRSLYGDEYEGQLAENNLDDGLFPQPPAQAWGVGKGVNPDGSRYDLDPFDNPALGDLVLDALERQRFNREPGVGRHFSDDPSVARNNFSKGQGLPVAITDSWKGQGEDPYRANTGGAYGNEREITKIPYAPINVSDVEIKHPETGQWRSVLVGNPERMAARELEFCD